MPDLLLRDLCQPGYLCPLQYTPADHEQSQLFMLFADRASNLEVDEVCQGLSE